jgi:hypothetical protein
MTSVEPITEQQLRQILAAADPGALLVPPSLVRRAIKHCRKLGGPGLRVPHRHLYVLSRSALLEAASVEELGSRELPEVVLLLPIPGPSELKRLGRDGALTRYWRLLYHGAIHREVSRRRARGEVDLPARVAALGEAFHEAREVLRQDHLLLGAEDEDVYEEMACVYLELRAFDPERLAYTFPELDAGLAEAVFSRDVNADELLQRCRPEGAERSQPEAAPDPDVFNDEPEPPNEAGSFREKAARAALSGNVVRAALLLKRAARQAPAAQRAALIDEARSHLDALTARVIRVMSLPEEEAPRWRDALHSLLEPASRGYWNREARLAYDIQRAVSSLEKPVYSADVAEWVITLLQRPVKRPLPDVPVVLAIQYLRKAIALVHLARIPGAARGELSELLHGAENHLSRAMRDALRPKVLRALEDAGFRPDGPAEEQSRARLAEELLDRVEANGRVSLPDLRDVVARNRVNLPDLAASDLIFGDPLLRANEALSRSMDGVYRRGEVYLRLMQVVSSLFFGTVAGRLLTLYLLLPALAALFTVVGVDALVGEAKHVSHFFASHHHEESHSGEKAEKPKEFKLNLFDIKSEAGRRTLYATLAAAAVFYLLLIHSASFRSVVLEVLRLLWRMLRWAVFDLPRAVLRLPFIRAILNSPAAQAAWRLVGRPLCWAFPLPLLLWLVGVGPVASLTALAVLTLFLAVALNTRLGILLEERAADALSRAWILLRDDFLIGLWTFLVWFFGWLTNRIFSLMYTVDEMLRFREGESQATFVLKCVAGVFWFAISYVVRFVWLLFVEPQINPIKHFPVVTVGHKLSILAIGPVSQATGMSVGWTTFILGIVPGIYGFIAWELKENWRLYRANQSETVDPEVVGGHGEWVINYIRPGFHSGTLPVLFARLRNTSGRARGRAEEGLHHVDVELRRFVLRAFLEPLKASRAWQGSPEVEVSEIHLTTRSIRIELRCDSLGPPAKLSFANRDGELVATLSDPGWLARLDGDRGESARALMAAFLHRAGASGAEPLPWARYAAWWRADREGGARPSLSPPPGILQHQERP